MNQKDKKKIDKDLKKLFTADFIKDVHSTPKLLHVVKASDQIK